MTEILESNKFGRIQLNDIDEFEAYNNVTFPQDYKIFLVRHNGGKPSPNIVPSVRSDVQWIFGMVTEPYYASIFQHIDMFHKRNSKLVFSNCK